MSDDKTSGRDVVTVAAEMLHLCGVPGAGARLRDEHDHDGNGRCRGCPHAGTVAPWFPCLLRLIGETAAELDERAAAGHGTEWRS